LLSDKASYACNGINVFGFHLWHISYCTYSIVNTSCQLIVNHVLDAKEVIGNHKCINRRTDNIMTRRKKVRSFEIARASREVVVHFCLFQSDFLLCLVYCKLMLAVDR
jgi:hypothetical protein